jgi:hypothetical protein
LVNRSLVSFSPAFEEVKGVPCRVNLEQLSPQLHGCRRLVFSPDPIRLLGRDQPLEAQRTIQVFCGGQAGGAVGWKSSVRPIGWQTKWTRGGSLSVAAASVGVADSDIAHRPRSVPGDTSNGIQLDRE